MNKSIPCTTGNQEADRHTKTCLSMIALVLVIGLLKMTNASADDEGQDLKVSSVSDFNFTMKEKPAVSIVLSNNKGRSCDITLNRESVMEGYTVNSEMRSDTDVEIDCSWDGDYYVQSANHPTFVKFEIETLDEDKKEAVIKTSLHLVSLKNEEEKYLEIDEFEVTVSGTDFDHLTTMPEPPKPDEIYKLHGHAEKTKAFDGRSPLSDETVDDFLKQYAKDFKQQAKSLINGFDKYHKKGDLLGYTLFKNKKWQPDFRKKENHYDAIFEANRKYCSENDLDWLFINFSELKLNALNFMYGFRNNDQSQIQKQLDDIVAKAEKLNGLLKYRKIETKK